MTLYKYSEVVAIMLLIYFIRVIPLSFVVIYGAFLIAVCITKNYFLAINGDKPSSGSLLLPLCQMLTEVMTVFITYNLGTLSLTRYAMIAAVITAFSIMYTASASGRDFNFNIEPRHFFIAGSVLLIAGFVISLRRTTAHQSIEIFRTANFFFVMAGTLYAVNKDSKYIFYTIMCAAAAIVPLFLILLRCHEIGTIMYVVLSDFLFLLILSIILRNWFSVGLILLISAGIFLAWLYLYNTPSAQELLNAALNDWLGHDFSDQMSRLFIRYRSSDQLAYLNQIVFGSVQGESLNKTEVVLSWAPKLFAPMSYTEIVSWEDNAFTSAADYACSTMFFTNPIFSAVLFIGTIAVYVREIIHSVKRVTFLIPLGLLVCSLTHILGNLLLFPFTGVPLPFLSYGWSSLITNTIIVIFFTYVEEFNPSDVEYER